MAEDNANIAPIGVTTTQRDAIPANQLVAGLTVLNTTTHKLNFYDGSAWVAITSA